MDYSLHMYITIRNNERNLSVFIQNIAKKLLKEHSYFFNTTIIE